MQSGCQTKAGCLIFYTRAQPSLHMAQHMPKTDPKLTSNRTILLLGVKSWPQKPPTKPQMGLEIRCIRQSFRIQRVKRANKGPSWLNKDPNIASTSPNTCPKPTQIQPERNHESVGVGILARKGVNRAPSDPTKAQHSPKIAQQRPNIVPNSPA